MKKVIEILKQAESEVSCVCVAADGKYPGRNRKLLDSTIRHIREAIDELKTPRWIPYKNLTAAHDDMDEAKEAVEGITFCGRNKERRIRLALNRIECAKGAIETLIPLSLPRWETTEQYEKRTGEVWKGAVYFNAFRNDTNKSFYTNGEYQVSSTKDILETIRNVTHITGIFDFKVVVICATEAGRPPDGWRPEDQNITGGKDDLSVD
jgi:hypothetical protein